MINDIVNFFESVNQQNTYITVLLIYISIFLLIAIFRILVFSNYKSKYLFFKYNSKKLLSIEDIDNIKKGLLSKIIMEYTEILTDNYSNISASSIVEKHISKIKFLGISSKIFENIIKIFERSTLLIGFILLIAFSDYKFTFAITALIIFLISLIIINVFEFDSAKENLKIDLINYIEREVDKFFTSDVSGSIKLLKDELSKSISSQSESLASAINKLGNDIAGVLKLSVNEMSKAVEKTVDKVSNVSEILEKPMKEWNETLSKASNYQNAINESLLNFNETCNKFSGITDSLKDILRENKLQVLESSKISQENLNKLISLNENILEVSEYVSAIGETTDKQLGYIEKNQAILSESLDKYEFSLEKLTKDLGDCLGNILDFYTQNSYNSLNETFAENFRLLSSENVKLITYLEKTFEELKEQDINKTRIILNMREQMDKEIEIFKNNDRKGL